MIGELTATEIERVLSSNIIGRIGCHAFGKTYVVPITYAYDGQYIYVQGREGMKLHMMRSNPHVCFEVDSMDKLANWESVIANATFEELHGELASRAWRMLVDRVGKTASKPPGETVHPKAGKTPDILYRLRLDEKSGRFEKRA